MNRKNFLRNCLMAAAISICPKSLWPSMGEILEEEVKPHPDWQVWEDYMKDPRVMGRTFWWAQYAEGKCPQPGTTVTIQLSKESINRK